MYARWPKVRHTDAFAYTRKILVNANVDRLRRLHIVEVLGTEAETRATPPQQPDAVELRNQPGSRVRYLYEGNDITRTLRSANGWRVQLLRGSHVAIEVRVTPTGSAPIGSLKPATISATWRGDGTRVDAVRGLVKVVR